METTTVAGVGAGLVILGSWLIVRAVIRPVPITSFDLFAQCERLPLADVVHDVSVQRYLATKRGWRVGGLVVAAVFAVGVGMRAGRISVDFGVAFLGWFAGAVIAEWRLNFRRSALVRTAVLSRRGLRRYLGIIGLAVPLLSLAGVVVAAFVSDAPVLPAGGTLAGVFIPVAAAAITARHVLLRPAVESSPAVDHALRSRSLHALSGAVTACAAYGIAALILVSPRFNRSGSQTVPIAVVIGGVFAAAWIGTARGTTA